MPAVSTKQRLSVHRGLWKDCNKCELACQRSRIVLYRGRFPADVLFVGEAPGVSEDTLGKPFVGPAGQLLDHIIQIATDNTRDFSYAITNLVACFPKEAKGTYNHQPPVKAIKACKDRLIQMVSIADPKVIICVGSLAKKHAPVLLEGTYSGEYRDIVHPAALLRLGVAQQGLAIQQACVAVETVVRTLG